MEHGTICFSCCQSLNMHLVHPAFGHLENRLSFHVGSNVALKTTARRIRGVISANATDDDSGRDPGKDASSPGIVDIFLKLALGVFTLGFIDAGYSGDWSRIGVLSKESEAALRDAAYGVVPLSLALICAISKRQKSK